MKLTFFADKLGICTSLVCMIHCLLVPFLLIIGFDSLMHLFDQEWIEITLLSSSLIIGSFSFIKGYVLHRQHFVPVLFLSGFLLLVNGEAVSSLGLAISLSVIGALIIAYAHFQNLKLKYRAYSS